MKLDGESLKGRERRLQCWWRQHPKPLKHKWSTVDSFEQSRLTPHLNLRATVCSSLALHSKGGTLERSLNNAGILFGGAMMTLLTECGQTGLIAFTLSWGRNTMRARPPPEVFTFPSLWDLALTCFLLVMWIQMHIQFAYLIQGVKGVTYNHAHKHTHNADDRSLCYCNQPLNHDSWHGFSENVIHLIVDVFVMSILNVTNSFLHWDKSNMIKMLSTSH